MFNKKLKTENRILMEENERLIENINYLEKLNFENNEYINKLASMLEAQKKDLEAVREEAYNVTLKWNELQEKVAKLEKKSKKTTKTDEKTTTKKTTTSKSIKSKN